MVGGVISDIYSPEERNVPMALFSSAALLGTGLAPLISSVVVYHSTWRWVYYSQGIVSGFCVVVMILFFQETRNTVLLQRKADALNKYYEKLEQLGYYGVILADQDEVRRIRWTQRDGEKHDSVGEMIKASCYRPFRECQKDPNGYRQTLTIVRYACHRTGGIFLFALVIIQLGRALSPVQCRAAGV